MKEQKTTKAKKGLVINRRNNRTVDTSRAQHDPKWEHLLDGNERYTGVRMLKGKGDKTAFIGWKKGIKSSLTRAEVVEKILSTPL